VELYVCSSIGHSGVTIKQMLRFFYTCFSRYTG
jgi:hypothetical protein